VEGDLVMTVCFTSLEPRFEPNNNSASLECKYVVLVYVASVIVSHPGAHSISYGGVDRT
jgi:hypothetical protein